MKNKIQKILVTMMVVIAIGTTNSRADQFEEDFMDDPTTYTGRGALIGAGVGGTIGLVIGFSESSGCGDESLCGLAVPFYTGIGLGIGLILGAGVGALIPRHRNFIVTPIIDPTPGAAGGGVNFAMKF